MKSILLVCLFSFSTMATQYHAILSQESNKYKVEIKYDENGFSVNGIHKDTGTPYNQDGYDINEFDINGNGEEICYTYGQFPDELYSYKTRYSYSYAHANSLGINFGTYYFSYKGMIGTARKSSTSNSNFNYGYDEAGYRVTYEDNRYGYKK